MGVGNMISEEEYQDWLEEKLKDEYGEDNVKRGETLSTGREVDFLVETWLCDLAIEVENDAEAVIKGTSQALIYADHSDSYAPVVVHPPTNQDEEELRMLSHFVPNIEKEPFE